MIKKLIAIIYERHLMAPHAADYEVCGDLLCRFGMAIERYVMGWYK